MCVAARNWSAARGQPLQILFSPRFIGSKNGRTAASKKCSAVEHKSARKIRREVFWILSDYAPSALTTVPRICRVYLGRSGGGSFRQLANGGACSGRPGGSS